MHKHFQYIVEDWPFSWIETGVQNVSRLAGGVLRARAVCGVALGLCVVHMVDGLPLVAGQIDLLLKLVDSDEYILIDKRTNPKRAAGCFSIGCRRRKGRLGAKPA